MKKREILNKEGKKITETENIYKARKRRKENKKNNVLKKKKGME